MKLRAFNVALWLGLTAWTSTTKPWLAPGFGALAASQATILLGATWRRLERHAIAFFLGFLAFGYLGLIYLLSLVAGTPRTAAFWAVFGAALAILGPAIVLARRLLFGSVR